MGNRFSDLSERINPSQEDNDNNNNQNNSGSNNRNSARRRNPTRSTDYQSQASPYSATPNRSNPSIHSERVTRLLNSLREANQSQNVLVQLQRAQNNRSSARRRRNSSSSGNPLTENTNFPHLPDMRDFMPLNLFDTPAGTNDNSGREFNLGNGDHPLFPGGENGLPPSLFSGRGNLPPGIPLPSLLNSVPFPFFNPPFHSQNSQEPLPTPGASPANGQTEGSGQNFQTRHQDLNRLLAAAIRAISLTASENQQNIHNSTRNEGAATPAAFMESFLQNLTQNSNNNVSEPVPRLSLITQASGNDDPSSASIVRVFRLERNENTESETNTEPASNQTSEGAEPNAEQSSAVPVLMIVIRSLTDPNNQNGANPAQPNAASTDANRTTATPGARPTLSDLQERILREHEAAHTNRTNNANSNSTQADSGSETPFTDSQRRSWIIYVIGSTYPPDHPLFSSLYSENPSYEDLLALTNILGPVVPQTTTQANVDKHLPIYHFDAAIPGIPDHKMIHIDRCQVCLEDFLDKESVRLLSCSHGFHKDCIDKWLTKGCNKCPVCRSKAVPSATTKPSDPSVDNPDSAATAN
jgi:hypothetical protein